MGSPITLTLTSLDTDANGFQMAMFSYDDDSKYCYRGDTNYTDTDIGLVTHTFDSVSNRHECPKFEDKHAREYIADILMIFNVFMSVMFAVGMYTITVDEPFVTVRRYFKKSTPIIDEYV